MPGATVVVRNTATRQKQMATTDEHGLYSFPVVSVGQYDLEISCPGFQPYRRTGLTININSASLSSGSGSDRGRGEIRPLHL